MKVNAKMKSLSLAIAGLAGFAFAGSALAQCPSLPGAWTAAPTFQGTLAINTPGYSGTNCRLDASISAGASGAAFATVQDDTPSAEGRYRAQFILNANALTNQSLLQGVQVFSAAGAAGTAVWFTVFGDGAGNRFLGYFVTDSTQASGVRSNSTPLAAGENRIEFDLNVGASGSIALWVNNTNEASPTVPAVTINNQAQIGIDTAYLGLAAPTPQYVSGFAGALVGFDQFDSRRSTFIGSGS